LADTCEASGEIDVERAKASLARAKERLAQAAHDDSIDADRARAALERAEARIAAAYTRGS